MLRWLSKNIFHLEVEQSYFETEYDHNLRTVLIYIYVGYTVQ